MGLRAQRYCLEGENAVERNVVKPRRKEEWPRENSERR